MTKELRAEMEALRGTIGNLNKATRDAAAVIAAANDFLRETGVGVAGVAPEFSQTSEPETDDFGSPTGSTAITCQALAYGRLNGDYSIHIATITKIDGGRPGDPRIVSSEGAAWSSFSREAKLASVATLPDLLRMIGESARHMMEKSAGPIGEVREMLESMGQTIDEREDIESVMGIHPKHRGGVVATNPGGVPVLAPRSGVGRKS